MSDTKITQTYIFNIARSKEVDKNQNGQLEGDEISIFEKKLEEKGVTNPQIYVAEFNKSKDAVRVDVVNKYLKDGFDYFWGTDFDDLDQAFNQIDSRNVLEVLESYDDGDSLIQRLDDEISWGFTSGKLKQYGTTIIKALLDVAKERNIDVSDIVAETTNGASKAYAVGPSVKNANQDEPATDSDNLDLVVTALRERIESQTELLTNTNVARENSENSLLTIANQIDSEGNKDGLINGDEIGKFKAACAKLGIFINDILSSIAKKTDKKEELSNTEQMVKNIFSANIKQISAEKAYVSNQVNGITSSIKDHDAEELRKYISAETVNASNVENLLSKLDSNDGYKELADGYSTTYVATYNGVFPAALPSTSEGNNIANKLIKVFGDDAREFNAVILKALYERAEANDVDVSDIVKCSNDEFFTPEGEYALDSKYVNKVIEGVRNRINEKLGEK